MTELVLRRDQYLEFEKIALGSFSPLTGFMNEDDFDSVVETMHLANGAVFPLPVVLDVDDDERARMKGGSKVSLIFEGKLVGEMNVDNVYQRNKQDVARKVFGVSEDRHPGARHFCSTKPWFAGGAVKLMQRASVDVTELELTPAETRQIFKDRNWKTVVGFQTRNVPHRAHEHLLRLALEFADGLFIQPLIGWKKNGDYTPRAVLSGYRALLDQILPKERIVLGVLTAAMRYAGPREAVLHALIRRNHGCTHFIVGRDHAGVGNYYEKYEAQATALRMESELGIKIMALAGPFYCARCDGIATERTCGHYKSDPAAVTEISGTLMRQILAEGAKPDRRFMRPEVMASLAGVPIFIEEQQT